MILSKIIKSNSWLSVRLTLERFPDQIEFWDDYEKVFYELQILQPEAINITINVKLENDTNDNTDYVDIAGYYSNPANRTDQYTNSLALEFVPWNEWLGNVY